jgi:hypothetical protein
MTMWISKNLGGGFRIGTTIRTGPTQAELRRMEKEVFISTVKDRFASVFLKYMMQNGYYVTKMQHLHGVDIEDKILEPINGYLDNFKDVMRLLDDGGSLTEKRKEILLRSVYGIEDILAKNNKLMELYFELKKLEKFSWSTGAGISLFLLFICGLTSFPLQLKNIVWLVLCVLVYLVIALLRRKQKEQRKTVIYQIRQNAIKIISTEELKE